MSLTFSLEIGSANNSPSLRYLPFENFVTHLPFRCASQIVFTFFGQQTEEHRTVNGKYLLNRFAEVNGEKTKSLHYRHAKGL